MEENYNDTTINFELIGRRYILRIETYILCLNIFIDALNSYKSITDW